MFVERILPVARKRLVSIKDDAPVIKAAKLLLDCHTDLQVVRGGGIECHDMDRHMQPTERPVKKNVWSIMKERGLKNLPVLDQGLRPIGVLSARDALCEDRNALPPVRAK